MSVFRAFLLRFLCVIFILCSFKLPVIMAVPEMPNIVCPEYFQYVCLGERCVGKVTLRNIFLSTIDLEVQLVQTTLVTRGNYGSISLIQDESNIKTGQLISYRVDFPLANVLPRVTRIKVNENVICQSHDYLFLPPFSQTMFLKHHLVLDLPKLPDGQRAQFQTVAKSEPPKPQTKNNANQVAVQMEQQPAPIDIRSRNSFAPIGGTQQAAPTQSQVQPQSRSVSTNQQSERAQQQCRYQRIDLNELTDGVGVAQAGSLPWLAAVFRRQRKSVSYSCDGALISPRTVVTAAQCLQRHELLPEVTIVFLGWSDLADWSEAGTQPHAVQDIIMHPDYVQNGQPDADLALMQLKTPAVINQYVSPICLWRDTTAANGRQQTLNGQKAIVAGWPMVTPNQESNQPQITETMLVDNEKCATISPESSQQQRTLCTEQKAAAQQQQPSDNQNKSCLENGRGSGLLMSHANQQWELRGITTAARSGATNGDDNCSSQVTAPGYSSYCDLTKHRLWLLNLMQF